VVAPQITIIAMAIPALRRFDNIMMMQDMTAAAALYKTVDGDFELGNSLIFRPDFFRNKKI